MPGYLMRRGTILLAGDCGELSPTFVDCGIHELGGMRLMAAFLRPYSTRAASLASGRLRRLAGDMATLGKGELLVKDRR
jgi:formylmethanofuran dehydrogenase subunit C